MTKAATKEPTQTPIFNRPLHANLNKEERHEILVAKIDKFGELKAAIAPLETQAKKLGDELKDALPEGTTEGNVFEVLITRSTKRVVNNAKFIKKKGQALFNKLATLAIKSLEDVMGKVEIDEVTEDGDETISIKPKAIKRVKV